MKTLFKIISFLLSVILVISLFSTVVLAAAKNLFSPDTIIDMVSGLDYEATINDALEKADVPQKLSFKSFFLMESTTKNAYVDADGNVIFVSADLTDEKDQSISIIGGADDSNLTVSLSEDVTDVLTIGAVIENGEISNAKEYVVSFLESNVGKEIIAEYTSAISDAITGGEGKLDPAKIKAIIHDNKDEVYDLYEKHTGQTLDRAEANQVLEKVLDESFDEVMAQLPEPKTVVGEVPEEARMVIEVINNDTYLTAIILVDCILIALIFVLRFWGFAGLLWISIDGLITSTLLGCVYIVLSLGLKTALKSNADGAAIISALSDSLLGNIMLGTVIILAASVALMVAYIIISFIKNKAKKLVS